MRWSGPVTGPTEEAMRAFIVREVGRVLRTDDFAHDFVGEAERLLRGIRGMLPEDDDASESVTYDSSRQVASLTGTLVLARIANPPGSEETIGILKAASQGYEVNGRPVEVTMMRAITQADADRMLRLLEKSEISWPPPDVRS